MIKTKTDLLYLIVGLFVGSLLISNILTGVQFCIGDICLTCGVIVFPIVYIVNDMLVEVYGYGIAKKVIITGFIVQLVAVLSYAMAMVLPTPEFAQANMEAFEVVFATSGRILLASFLAYLTGSFLNAKVMVRFKERMKDQLALRCITSTVIGEGLDSMIFMNVAFLGIMPIEEILTLAICEATFKILFETFIYPVTRTVIHKVEALP